MVFLLDPKKASSRKPVLPVGLLKEEPGMPGQCCHHCDEPAGPDRRPYRMVLRIPLAINFAMFGVEVVTGLRGDSASLMAASLDFLGDAANYGISLFVLGHSLTLRANAPRMNAASMFAFGLWVLGLTTGTCLTAARQASPPCAWLAPAHYLQTARRCSTGSEKAVVICVVFGCAPVTMR